MRARKLARFLVAGSAMLVVVVSSGPAWAASQSGSLSVNVTVEAACNVQARDLDFGSYNPLTHQSSPQDGEQVHGVGVNCTKGTDFVVALNYGSHGGSATNRYMAMTGGGAGKLAYNLYVDAGRSNVWYSRADGCDLPSGSSGHCRYGSGAGPGAAGTQWFPVYGRIPPQPAARPGHYKDTVTVTVTFN